LGFVPRAARGRRGEGAGGGPFVDRLGAQRRRGGSVLTGGIVGQFAEAEPAVGVDDEAAGSLAFLGGHAPAAGRSKREHRARAGRGFAARPLERSQRSALGGGAEAFVFGPAAQEGIVFLVRQRRNCRVPQR